MKKINVKNCSVCGNDHDNMAVLNKDNETVYICPEKELVVVAPERCKCFENFLKVSEEKIKEQFGDKKIANLNVGWEKKSFFPDGEDYSPVNPVVKIEYNNIKKDGTEFKNKTTETFTILSSYCCFCGRKLNKMENIK